MSEDPSMHRRSRPSAEGLRRLQIELGLDEPLRVVRRLGGGLGAATHLLAAGRAQYVLKRYTPRDQVVSAESAALAAACDAGLPAPTPVAVDPDGRWFGTPALVMSRLPGRFDLAPRKVATYVEDVADLLVKVHAVSPPTAVVRSHPPATWAVTETPTDGLLRAATVRRIRQAIADLPEVAAGEPATFCHGDCHPGNLLWRAGRLTGLVDWSGACTSIRWWELAYMRVELAVLTSWTVATELLRDYRARTGEGCEHQAQWDLFHTHTGHRWAHTWLQGWQEQGRRDLSIDDVADRLERMAQRLLREC